MVSTISNIVLITRKKVICNYVETDVNYTYYGDHFPVHPNIKSLCCTPKTNVLLCQLFRNKNNNNFYYKSSINLELLKRLMKISFHRYHQLLIVINCIYYQEKSKLKHTKGYTYFVEVSQLGKNVSVFYTLQWHYFLQQKYRYFQKLPVKRKVISL